jgi:hypothetical protein
MVRLSYFQPEPMTHMALFSDNISKLNKILKDFLYLARDAEFKDENQQSAKICRLLDMLVHMQALNISIRAELIKRLFSLRVALPDKIMGRIRNSAGNTTKFDRRRSGTDRRKLHTYLANDPRSGIADRRSKTGQARAAIRPDQKQPHL